MYFLSLRTNFGERLQPPQTFNSLPRRADPDPSKNNSVMSVRMAGTQLDDGYRDDLPRRRLQEGAKWEQSTRSTIDAFVAAATSTKHKAVYNKTLASTKVNECEVQGAVGWVICLQGRRKLIF